MTYVAGCNIPGYLPDSDPAEFDGAADALEYVRELCVSHFEDDPDVSDETFEECKAGVRTWSADQNGEFGVTVGPLHYWVTQQ